MAKVSRQQEWVAIRRKWVANNPPNHEGYYICGICGQPVQSDSFELHHVWGRKGELLSNESHLVPTHALCNQEVGSKRGVRSVSSEEYELRKQMDL